MKRAGAMARLDEKVFACFRATSVTDEDRCVRAYRRALRALLVVIARDAMGAYVNEKGLGSDPEIAGAITRAVLGRRK